MLNALRPLIARLLTPVGKALARTPVTPNAITITGTTGVVVGALWLFPTGHLFAGTMVCTGFVLADMLDGLLARVKGTSGHWRWSHCSAWSPVAWCLTLRLGPKAWACAATWASRSGPSGC